MKTIKIAYAEDHIAVRKGIINLLEQTGEISVTVEANNGKELINLLDKLKEMPDMCMLDICMPELNGFDALVEIKKKWPEMKSLIYTTFATDIYILRMILNGANGYLFKTCDPIEIKNAIYAIYNSGTYFPDEVSRNFFHAIQNNKLKIPEITDKEFQVLRYSCSDLSYDDISRKMKTTKRSVEGYRDSLFKKLNVNSRVSLVMFAIKFGYFPLETNHLV